MNDVLSTQEPQNKLQEYIFSFKPLFHYKTFSFQLNWKQLMLPNITMVRETSSFNLRVLQTKKVKRNLVYNIFQSTQFCRSWKEISKQTLTDNQLYTHDVQDDFELFKKWDLILGQRSPLQILTLSIKGLVLCTKFLLNGNIFALFCMFLHLSLEKNFSKRVPYPSLFLRRITCKRCTASYKKSCTCGSNIVSSCSITRKLVAGVRYRSINKVFAIQNWSNFWFLLK